jgi:hypothetical protein
LWSCLRRCNVPLRPLDRRLRCRYVHLCRSHVSSRDIDASDLWRDDVHDGHSICSGLYSCGLDGFCVLFSSCRLSSRTIRMALPAHLPVRVFANVSHGMEVYTILTALATTPRSTGRSLQSRLSATSLARRLAEQKGARRAVAHGKATRTRQLGN